MKDMANNFYYMYCRFIILKNADFRLVITYFGAMGLSAVCDCGVS